MVRHGYHVVRRVILATNSFIIMQRYFPNKEPYDTHRMVQITEEVPEYIA